MIMRSMMVLKLLLLCNLILCIKATLLDSVLLSITSLSTTPLSPLSPLSLKRTDDSRIHIEHLYLVDNLLSQIEENFDSDSRRKLAKICLELCNLRIGETIKINDCHQCMYSSDVKLLYELCGIVIDNNNNSDDNYIVFKKTNISPTPSISYLLKDHTNKRLDSNDLNRKIVSENKIKTLFKIASTTIEKDNKDINSNNNNEKKDDDNIDNATTRNLVLAAWNENNRDDKRQLSTSSHKLWMKYCTRYRPYKYITIRVYDSQEYPKQLLAQIKISTVSTVNDLLISLQKHSNHENIDAMIKDRKLYSIENTKLKPLPSLNTSLISSGLLPPNINLFLL